MEKYLYLILDIFSFAIPFAYSFERKRMHFIKYWKPYFSAIIIVGLFFIIWDVYFAYQNIWGFNDRYLVGLRIFKLPLEEWLFFLLIPYASNFIHYSLLYFFPKPKISLKLSQVISWSLFAIAAAVAILNYDKMYTLCSFGLFAILMLMQSIFKFQYFQRYVLSFIIIFIPFFIVNSWLTGSYTPEPIVSYDDTENLGIRLGTIPLEDCFYCFSMLYSSVLLFEFFKIRFYENPKL